MPYDLWSDAVFRVARAAVDFGHAHEDECTAHFGEPDAHGALDELLTAVDALRAPDLAEALDLLENLATAEAAYRFCHDHEGGESIVTGRAWDIMRRAGDRGRAFLASHGRGPKTDGRGDADSLGKGR